MYTKVIGKDRCVLRMTWVEEKCAQEIKDGMEKRELSSYRFEKNRFLLSQDSEEDLRKGQY